MTFASNDVRKRIDQLDIPFGDGGFDRYGTSKERLGQFYTVMTWLYEHYFRVHTTGIDHVPDEGRVMLIGNHSGTLPTDGAMVSAAMFNEHEPPRFVHAMADYFFARMPFVSSFFREIGQQTGVPGNATNILRDERVLMVFPEGASGTGKPYTQRYNLLRFGSGFMRLAMETDTPIVPFGFVGGEEALPMLYRFDRIANWLGLPYLPVLPQILPIPFPVTCQLRFGEPVMFDGDSRTADEQVNRNIMDVKRRIKRLLNRGLSNRSSLYPS